MRTWKIIKGGISMPMAFSSNDGCDLVKAADGRWAFFGHQKSPYPTMLSREVTMLEVDALADRETGK